MSTFEEDLIQDAEDDRLTVEYIKNYLPQDLKDRFTEDELYYFIDVIGEYYVDLLDKQMGDFDPEDLRWVVDGELEYGETTES